MFEKFSVIFVDKNCRGCTDYYGYSKKSKYQNTCPIYKLLNSAQLGMRDFPVEHIDRENIKCRKNYHIEKNETLVEYVEKKSGKPEYNQKEKLF